MRRSIPSPWPVLASIAVAVMMFISCSCDRTPQSTAEPSVHAGDEVETRVKKIVGEQLNVDAAKLRLSDQFVRDLGADDLDKVELVMDFEDSFGLSISDEAAEKMVAIQDAVVYIRKHNKDNGKIVEPQDQPDK